jgi:deoxyribodipyrimidine photolyase-related protein
MKAATLILPNQLFKEHPGLTKNRLVILIEHPRFFSERAFHKQKLILHRGSMQYFADRLTKEKYHVEYIEHAYAQDLFKYLEKWKISELHAADWNDHTLSKEMNVKCKKADIELTLYPSPMFLTPDDFIKKELGNKKKFLMHNFYVAQRKRMKILISNGKPTGGSWSFDQENRKSVNEEVKIPLIPKLPDIAYLKEAKDYVEKKFKDNPGNTDLFNYPITHTQAETQFQDFLKHRLVHFGDYQDALVQGQSFLFHSVLTPGLNCGLITPAYVVETTLEYARLNKTPINNLEGFVRQIIGWREFIRAVYLLKGEEQDKSNFLENKRVLPDSFWSASTGIEPIDDVISKTVNHAYAHHIERLMILGNFMLLCEIDPDEVYRWFMELFIDAYDWVMVPNIYGMSQYADGGLMITKPYVSSSNYICKMSDYKKGAWCSIWDALYWHFIYKHHALLNSIPRAKIMASPLARMDAKKLAEQLKVAKAFLATLN